MISEVVGRNEEKQEKEGCARQGHRIAGDGLSWENVLTFLRVLLGGFCPLLQRAAFL